MFYALCLCFSFLQHARLDLLVFALDLMKPNYLLSCNVYVVIVIWVNVSSTLGLRKLANFLYGNKLERLKKRESYVH